MGKFMSVVGLLAVMVSLVFAGCNTPAPTPATTPAPTPTTTTTPPIASTTTPTLTTTTAPKPTTTTIIYDFTSGSPALLSGQSTPFAQTVGGVTANFSSPSSPASFSVQNPDATFLRLSQFSGNYLNDNDILNNNLEIRFSRPLLSISLTFATIDYHGPGNVDIPTSIKITAYLNTKGTALGSTTARGTFSNDSFPQGTLAFDSGGQPFDLVVIELIPQPRGATYFLVDNITIVGLLP